PRLSGVRVGIGAAAAVGNGIVPASAPAGIGYGGLPLRTVQAGNATSCAVARLVHADRGQLPGVARFWRSVVWAQWPGWRRAVLAAPESRTRPGVLSARARRRRKSRLVAGLPVCAGVSGAGGESR